MLNPDDRQAPAWIQPGPPELRLARFDSWVRHELARRLDWSWAGDGHARRIEQCRVYLERLVLEMWRRGWMLDGKLLAAHLVTVLDRIGKYQRSGQVLDFWPYFKVTVNRYVGANAEEIAAEAMSAGAHIMQVLGAVVGPRPAVPGAPLPALLAQRADETATAKADTIREKQSRLRRLQAARKAVADQPQLF